MKAFLISPSHPLIEEIVSHLSGVDKDYSSSLVVFPGKRPSHFLIKALAEKEGSSFLPPRIFSMDEFVDTVDGEILGHRKRKLEPIDAVAILYEIHRTSPDPLGEKSFLDPDTFFPIGLKISATVVRPGRSCRSKARGPDSPSLRAPGREPPRSSRRPRRRLGARERAERQGGHEGAEAAREPAEHPTDCRGR